MRLAVPTAGRRVQLAVIAVPAVAAAAGAAASTRDVRYALLGVSAILGWSQLGSP